MLKGEQASWLVRGCVCHLISLIAPFPLGFAAAPLRRSRVTQPSSSYREKFGRVYCFVGPVFMCSYPSLLSFSLLALSDTLVVLELLGAAWKRGNRPRRPQYASQYYQDFFFALLSTFSLFRKPRSTKASQCESPLQCNSFLHATVGFVA